MHYIQTLGILDGIGDAISGAFKSALNWIGDKILEMLKNLIGMVCYLIVKVLCYLVKIVYSFFGVFSGIEKVTYDGKDSYLINVFFGNKSINNIYWGMALLGIALCIAFTIVAIVRKTFDLEGKQQRGIGSILLSAGKSILIILLMSAIMVASLSMTNLLLAKVTDIFLMSDTLFLDTTLTFTDEQFATMARILNTVGNYSLNDSYNSRYNLNSCYNDIREDLLILQKQHVFEYYYSEENGQTWQSMIAKIVQERDPSAEVMIDDRNTSTAILDLMEVLRTNKDFKPVKSVSLEGSYASTTTSVPIDTIIFLIGTMNAARNSYYNENPSLTDAVRSPFYYGTKSIYSYSDVKSCFDIAVGGISYLMIAIAAFMTLKNLTLCMFNAIARIYNLLGLYLVSPAFLAVQPLDDGAKFKQWMTATVVQMFGIFGNVIPMLLIIKFIPMIFDSKLVLNENGFFNIIAKAFLLIASFEASNRFSGLFNGILAGNASMTSAHAGDMSNLAQRTGRIAGAVTGISTVEKNAGKLVDSMENHYGLIGGMKHYGDKDDKDKDKDGKGGNSPKKAPKNK